MFGLLRKLIRSPTRRSSAFWGLVFSVFLATASVLPMSAAAQTAMPRDKVEALLKARYGETPVARGLMQNGWMIEVFASSDGDTWTIVFTTPEGVSRVGSAGVAWSEVDTKLGQLSSLAQVN